MDLRQEARTYLQADRYEVDDSSSSRLDGERGALGGNERIFVWTADAGTAGFDRVMRPLLRDMDAIDEEYPQARKVLLVPSREGISAEFTSSLSKYRVRTQTPIEFFDVNFSWDSGREVPTAARRLAQKGRSMRSQLVAQPFREKYSGVEADNLLLHLTQALTRPVKGPSIHVISGPAGIGKSALFESLYAAVLDDFMAKKKRRELAARPVPLLPEYLDVASARTVQSLLEGFLRTDFVRNVSPDVFEWMLLHGYAVWMLDGLDEVIALDSGFLPFLEDLATRPDATRGPQIVICVRDSLLATNEGLRELSDYQDILKIYELERWERVSINRYANLQLGLDAAKLMKRLDSTQNLVSLAGLPFYCQLLADLQKDGELRDAYSEENLVQHAVAHMIEREYKKSTIAIGSEALPESAIMEYVQALAIEDFEGDYTGIPVERAQEFAELVVPSGTSDEEAERLAMDLAQLPFFARYSGTKIRFAQELIEHFFLGTELCRLVKSDLTTFRRRLRYGVLPPHSLSLRMLVSFVAENGFATEIATLAEQAVPGTNEFHNLLQISLLAGTGAPSARRGEINLEYRELNGTLFRDCDLTGVSFRGSNLTDVTFLDCILRDTNLEEAIFMSTCFEGSTESSMQGARVSALARFVSLSTAKGLIDDVGRARAWFDKATGVTGPFTEPCAAAQQLRHLFRKFVHPDGSARRDSLSLNALTRGTRFANPRAIVDVAVKNSYLLKQPPHGLLRRADGALYTEMVEYVRDLHLTAGLRGLVDGVCGTPGCQHVPTAQASAQVVD